MYFSPHKHVGEDGLPHVPKDPAVERRKLLSPQETAEWLGVSLASIYRMVEGGQIGVVRVSASLRFSKNDIEAYIASRRTAPRS